MKRIIPWVWAASLAAAGLSGGWAAAQQRPVDPIAEFMFPPDLVMRHGQEIGLTEEQKQALQAELQKAQGKLAGLQGALQQENEAMGELLKEEKPDEAKVQAQLDKVVDAERAIKRVHLGMIVALKNLLTAEQQKQLQEIKQKLIAKGAGPGGGPPLTLQLKMQQVGEAMRQWKVAGRDPTAVEQGLREMEPLLREGKFKEAEAVAERALKDLAEEPKK